MTAPQLAIVPMLAAHIDALMPFEREMFGTEAWTANGYRTELADVARRFYLAAEATDGSLLGWAGLMVVGESAEILTVGVVPASRRQGVGRALLAALIDEARTRAAVEVFLEVRVDNEAARALYAAAEFVEVGIRAGYYDAGRVDAVVMRRDL